MNTSNYRFTLDLHSTQSQISLPVTKGDTARAFYISLSDGGLPFHVPKECYAALSVNRPTGSYFEAGCVIESGTTIKYDFDQNPNTAAVAGVHDCSVILYGDDNRVIASPRFTMIVSERLLDSDDFNITDEDEISLRAMYEAEGARQAAENGRANKEAERQRNEDERQLAEEGRKETLKTFLDSVDAGKYETKYTYITLPASSWQGTEDPYWQVVTVQGATEYSKVDLLPSPEQLSIFHDKDIAFVTENDNGVVTVYCIGDKPMQDYDIEVCVTEVVV